jgi:hypothetical protein
MDCRGRREGRQVGLYPGSHRHSPADDGGSKSLRGDQLQLYMKLRESRRSCYEAFH